MAARQNDKQGSTNGPNHKKLQHSQIQPLQQCQVDSLKAKISPLLKSITVNSPVVVNSGCRFKEACRYYNNGGCNRGHRCYYAHYERWCIHVSQMAKQILKLAETRMGMEIITGWILQFGVKYPEFNSKYAELCNKINSNLFAHLVGKSSEYQWLLIDPDVGNTFRKMLIRSIHTLFGQHRNNSLAVTHYDSHSESVSINADDINFKIRSQLLTTGYVRKAINNPGVHHTIFTFYYDFRKQNVLNMVALIGELYNAHLIKRNLVYKGVFEVLLPPRNRNLREMDLEAICKVFEKCGKNLDLEHKKHVNKYLQKLQSHAPKFTKETVSMVNEIIRLRKQDWK